VYGLFSVVVLFFLRTIFRKEVNNSWHSVAKGILADQGNCLTLFAPIAINLPRFRSSQTHPDRFIAGIVIVK
jgi:hypothetical protein